MSERREFQERIGRIEGLIHKLDSIADPALRSDVRELLAAVMELQGAGFGRILEIAANSGEAAPAIMDAMGDDPLVGCLLVLHNLHPHDLETRVNRAIGKLRPLLRSRDAHLESIRVAEGGVRVKLVGDASGDLESTVREALLEAAPDASEVIIETTRKPAGFVPLSSLLPAAAVAAAPAETVGS